MQLSVLQHTSSQSSTSLVCQTTICTHHNQYSNLSALYRIYVVYHNIYTRLFNVSCALTIICTTYTKASYNPVRYGGGTEGEATEDSTLCKWISSQVHKVINNNTNQCFQFSQRYTMYNVLMKAFATWKFWGKALVLGGGLLSPSHPLVDAALDTYWYLHGSCVLSLNGKRTLHKHMFAPYNKVPEPVQTLKLNNIRPTSPCPAAHCRHLHAMSVYLFHYSFPRLFIYSYLLAQALWLKV